MITPNFIINNYGKKFMAKKFMAKKFMAKTIKILQVSTAWSTVFGG